MRIVAISDVHGKWSKLKIPECDILISAGDYSFKGEPHMVRDYHAWLNKQEAGYIISVQGNHELWVEKNFEQAKAIAEENCPAVHFIETGVIEIEGLKIYCSSVTPYFHNWAYNKYPAELEKHWANIPDDVNIVVTHGPPGMILDEVVRVDGTSYDPPRRVGCDHLAKRIKEIKPDLHIFGHIHCSYGQKYIDGTSYYNAAICDEMYMPSNPVTVIDYE